MEQLTYMLAGLVAPSSGALRIGGRDVERFPSAVTGRRIAYVGANAYHFVGSLRDNLLYGLKHRPLRPRSEEHTSELQSLMRISYAVFCLQKKTKHQEPT